MKESKISCGLVSPGQCPLKKKRFWLGNQQEMVQSGPEHQIGKFLNNGKRVSRLSNPSCSETCLGPTIIQVTGMAHRPSNGNMYLCMYNLQPQSFFATNH